MTIFEWLLENTVKLKNAGVDSPRRDCLVLIEDILKKDRAWVLAHHEQQLNENQAEILNEQLARRASREPLAYIRGKAWFYGRFFEVDPSVLIPRPESESFIEFLKELKPQKIIDVGTGSGCLAITAKLELPDAKVTATDTDEKALEIARRNEHRFCDSINYVHGSLLKSVEIDSDTTIMANLPYVPTGMVTSPEIYREPKEALFSGKDGLDHYTNFWQQVSNLKTKPRCILSESLESQHKNLEKLAKNSGYKRTKTDVLVQLFKRS